MFDIEDEGEDIQASAEAEGDGDIEPMRMANDPGKPTARQVEEHERTHLPFRSWCRWCVLGRGRGLQHRAHTGSIVPILGLDYFFLTSKGVMLKEELQMSSEEIETARDNGSIAKCLVVRCFASKNVFGHVVPRKGLDEDGIVVTMILRDLEWLGHTRVIIKADNEPAIQTLAQRVTELAKVEIKDMAQVSREDPAAYDSMSNGGTEIGVQLLRGLFRTIKLGLEQKINKIVPIDHPLIAWMMEHTSLLLNAVIRGTDGLTPWMRVRGRAFAHPMVGMGEAVLYRHPSKGPRHNPQGNVGALGAEGVFLGYSRTSNTFIVSDTNGDIVMSRSITRRPAQDRWDAETLVKVQAIPHIPRGRDVRDRVRFTEGASDTKPTAETARPPVPRDMRITKEDLEEYGYDANCAQCKYIIQWGKTKPGGKHSRECRARLMASMGENARGKERLRANTERLDRAIAEQIEAQDRTQPSSDAPHGG